MPPILPPLLFADSAALLPMLLVVSLTDDDTFERPSDALDVTFFTASVAFAVVDSLRTARVERTSEVSCRDGRWMIWRANMVGVKGVSWEGKLRYYMELGANE